MKVLKNCRFIPELMEGYEGTSGDVLVKDDRILKITECADEYPEDVEVYDMGEMCIRDRILSVLLSHMLS